MDRSLISAIRLSDVPPDLNTLIETWLTRFGIASTHVQLYYFAGEKGSSPMHGPTEHRVAIYTDNQQYIISARWGGERSYLGCIATSRKRRAGEEQHRGSDLSDGTFTYETWFRIMGDILSYEMVALAKTARPVPDGHAFPSDGHGFDNGPGTAAVA